MRMRPTLTAKIARLAANRVHPTRTPAAFENTIAAPVTASPAR
jgi:hypothetical protein